MEFRKATCDLLVTLSYYQHTTCIYDLIVWYTQANNAICYDAAYAIVYVQNASTVLHGIICTTMVCHLFKTTVTLPLYLHTRYRYSSTYVLIGNTYDLLHQLLGQTGTLTHAMIYFIIYLLFTKNESMNLCTLKYIPSPAWQ